VDQGFDWPAWIGAGASLMIIITAVIALRALRDGRRTRHGQLIVVLNARWDDQAVIDSAAHFRLWGSENTTKLVEALWSDDVTERDEQDLKDWYDLSIYPNVIEAIGLIQAEGAISIELVDKLWGTNIIDAWKDWKKPIYRLREVTHANDVLIGFEEIADRLASHRTQKERTRATG
jgi:hypothetical protein